MSCDFFQRLTELSNFKFLIYDIIHLFLEKDFEESFNFDRDRNKGRVFFLKIISMNKGPDQDI